MGSAVARVLTQLEMTHDKSHNKREGGPVLSGTSNSADRKFLSSTINSADRKFLSARILRSIRML